MLIPFRVCRVPPPRRVRLLRAGGGAAEGEQQAEGVVAPNEARLYHAVQYLRTLQVELESMQRQQEAGEESDPAHPLGRRIMAHLLLMQEVEDTIAQLQDTL